MAKTTDDIEMEELTVKNILEGVSDPEIPVLSVLDLGIVRRVKVQVPKKNVEIVITPTYSGCPAMNVIGANIKLTLHAYGYEEVNVVQELSPPWTTDWMTESGKQKLKSYGIAPPAERNDQTKMFAVPANVGCPQCGSTETRLLSEFGSTSCKSLYQCIKCKEPFEHFKCH